MSRLASIREDSTPGDLIEGQVQHAGLLFLMFVGSSALMVDRADAPALLWLTATQWAILSIWLVIIHQAVVAFVFRAQLHRNLMTRLFGQNDMKVWAMIFMPLLVARPLTMIMTGWADTVPITGFRGAEILLGVLLLGPAIWGMHSTLVHFTLPRALGGDHFRDEIASLPKVSEGVFRYTDNGMYGVVFLGLWGIAFLFGSWNALVLALFQHFAIWVHMYCTEGPDMRRIYK